MCSHTEVMLLPVLYVVTCMFVVIVTGFGDDVQWLEEEFDMYDDDWVDASYNDEEQPNTNKQNPLGVTDIIRELFEKSGYNKQEPPSMENPTKVEIGLYVNSFYAIREQNMEFSVSMYLRQQWLDPRLNFEHLVTNTKKIRLWAENAHKIWIPDTFFRNEKRASFHDVTIENRLVRLTADGMIWHVVKVSGTFSCQMKLEKYPMDTQICPILFESFGYTMDVVYFAWLPRPCDIDENLELPQFEISNKILYDCSQNYTSGAYPCLEIRFVLKRQLGYFLIQVYVPTILIVILSWVSFWINAEASPARVSIGLLTVLSLTTMSASARESLPKVSYIKAIDIWMIVSLIFVFTSLLEYAVVNVFSRKKTKTQNQKRKPAAIQRGGTFCQPINTMRYGTGWKAPEAAQKPQEPRITAERVDKFSRKLFPASFSIFIITYWVAYTQIIIHK